MHPELIGPYESADRVWSGMMWPLYLVLLFLVELHGGIGLYRLAVKWGDFSDPANARRKLKRLKWGFTVFFLVLGLVTLAAYIKLGIEHAPQAGERWIPQKTIGSSFPRMRESREITALDSRMRGNDGFFGALPAIPASMRAAP
jgi:fumarate reductase subunit C